MSRERSKRHTLPPAEETINKLKKVVEEGNHYGAQQMYKSISTRYVSALRYFEAVDILHSGACIQLGHGKITCGAELAVMFVDTLVKGKVPCDGESVDRVRTIYKKFPQIPVPQRLEDHDDDDMQKLSEALGAARTRVEGCSSFLKAAIKWSAEFGAPKYGYPGLHVILAEYIYSESPEVDMARVSYHFVRGNDVKKFVSVVINFMGKCYPGEDDLAISRAILLYLSLGNLRDANQFMDEINKQVDQQQLEFPRTDLMQFIIYLLPTMQRNSLPLFNMLRANYKAALDREPAFHELLEETAEKFYNVRRRNPLQGMFGDMFQIAG